MIQRVSLKRAQTQIQSARNWELRNISSDIQRKNLSVKQPARKFSHMSLEQICTDVIFLSVLCMVHEFLCQLVYLPHFSY